MTPDSTAVQGYTKFYQAGTYRAAIPAVKEVNTSDIYISHIASNADWWTGVSLVNTTSETKELTMTFNNGQTRNITLNANEHKAFSIRSLFNDQPQPDIESAVITHASGVIGLELFGSIGWGNQLEGILLTDKTTSTIYYPHVASDDYWWTGIVAYNPSASACTITITPYSAQGTPLPPSTVSHSGEGKICRCGCESRPCRSDGVVQDRLHDSLSAALSFSAPPTANSLGLCGRGRDRRKGGRLCQDREERLDRDCLRQHGSQRGVRDLDRL